MAVPTTRAEFKEHCLRSLGKPVIEINVDDDQIDDRIDDALSFYWDYHFDGTELTYFKHQIDANTISNQYIDLPEYIIGAVRIFDIGAFTTGSGDIFNLQYQMALNDLYSFNSASMVPFYTLHEKLALVQEILTGRPLIRYNRHRDRLHLDITKTKLVEGQWIIVECYRVVDPNDFPDVWGDRWLQRYCAQLIKKQWGSNLIKFEGMQLPGGITFNGQKIYDDATAELKELEDEMIRDYSLPVQDMWG